MSVSKSKNLERKLDNFAKENYYNHELIDFYLREVLDQNNICELDLISGQIFE